jgi:hypothetical protein
MSRKLVATRRSRERKWHAEDLAATVSRRPSIADARGCDTDAVQRQRGHSCRCPGRSAFPAPVACAPHVALALPPWHPRPVKSHLQQMRRNSRPSRGNRFRAWLRRRYYRDTGGTLGAAAMRSTLDLLEARAQFDGAERAVHLRVAEHAGHIYLDLADAGWRAVEIGPGGWRVIESPPVRFRRPAGMLPLPVRIKSGRSSSQPPTMLTVLTQTPALVRITRFKDAAVRGGTAEFIQIIIRLGDSIRMSNRTPRFCSGWRYDTFDCDSSEVCRVTKRTLLWQSSAVLSEL